MNTFQKFVILFSLTTKLQTWHAQIHLCNENWFHCSTTYLTFVFSPQIVHERKTCSTGAITRPSSAKANNNLQHFTIFNVNLFKMTKYFNLPLSSIFVLSNQHIIVWSVTYFFTHTACLDSRMTKVQHVFVNMFKLQVEIAETLVSFFVRVRPDWERFRNRDTLASW